MTGPVPLPTQFYALIQPVSAAPTLPTITGVSPGTGKVNEPSQIVITGTGFAVGAIVSVEDAAVNRVDFVSSTQLRAWITPIVVGAKDVAVINADGAAGVSADAITFAANVLFEQVMSEAITLTSGTQIRTADTVGKWKYANATSATSTSGGALVVEDVNLKLSDARCDRPRKKGRLHYVRFAVQAAGTFQEFRPLFLCDEVSTGSSQWWANGQGIGFQIKTGPVLRWRRLSTNDGVIVHGTYSAMSFNSTQEMMIIERAGVGCFGLIKESGTWRMKAVDHEFLTYDCRLGSSNNGATAFGNMDRLVTEETGWVPQALVSHSFTQADATTIGPSDGNASGEPGGSNITPTQSGLIQVASDRCSLSGDGVGYVRWESGEDEVMVSARLTVRDSSRVGLIVRGTDDNNCWIVRIDSTANTITIVERNAGTETTRATGTLSATPDFVQITTDTEYWVTAVCEGSNIKAWIDGSTSLHNSYCEWASASFQNTATQHGLLIEKGASVSSAAARSFMVFAHAQTPPEV
jgi:hypothetical protein